MSAHTSPDILRHIEAAFAGPPPGLAPGDAKIFRLRYMHQPRLLKDYLLERYRFGRSAEWTAGFYPARVRLDGMSVHDGTVVLPGQEIAYCHLRADEPPPGAAPPILYQDDWLLAVLKPDGLPVNPSGVYYFTSLAIRMRELLGSPELTPIHRLDLETSGLLVFAKRSADLARFHRLFADKSIRKIYRALVHGHLQPGPRILSGRIVPDEASAIMTRLRCVPAAVGPGVALTRIHAVAQHRAADGRALSEVLLEPVTGKTNQLRVQLAALGHPVVGDKKYHPDERVFLDWFAHRDFERLRGELLLPRQALHCQALQFPHPFTGALLRLAAPSEAWLAKVQPLIEPAPLPDPLR